MDSLAADLALIDGIAVRSVGEVSCLDYPYHRGIKPLLLNPEYDTFGHTTLSKSF